MTAIAIDSVEALRERIRNAMDLQMPLRVSGRGTWLDAGRPVRDADTISTRDLSGITAYVPGDLTLTARAGTTLGELRDATAAHGQWLALDPYGSDEGTVGATIATASAGPLSTAFGTPRDLVLGVEFVKGDGVVARGGGRVVKNVAGFDLTRLLTGSWGTLGVITEVTVRLHARPEADESIAVPFGSGSEAGGSEIEKVRRLLRRLPFTPYACEVVNAAFAKQLVGVDSVAAIVRLGGNREAVDAQRSAFAEVGDVSDVAADVWQRLRNAEPPRASTLRFSALPSDISATWGEAVTLADACAGTLVHATPARGVVRCIVPDNANSISGMRRALQHASSTTRIGERLPAELWSLCRSALGDKISSRIKRTFDPSGVLNPGILGEMS